MRLMVRIEVEVARLKKARRSVKGIARTVFPMTDVPGMTFTLLATYERFRTRQRAPPSSRVAMMPNSDMANTPSSEEARA